jgi:hypothetical protein
VAYAAKNDVPLPNLTAIRKSLERADELIVILRNDGHAPTSLQQPDRTPDKDNRTKARVNVSSLIGSRDRRPRTEDVNSKARGDTHTRRRNNNVRVALHKVPEQALT